MQNKRPISQKGLDDIKNEISDIVNIQRPKVITEIQEARAHGDLKENAEYHAAKEKQGVLEAKLAFLNGVLSEVEVIDYKNAPQHQVQFGAKVTYAKIESDETFTWKILGHDEADSKNSTISINSPVARALIGKEVGDVCSIKAPKGQIEVEIISITYED